MQDSSVLKSETNPREFSVTAMMSHFIFSSGINEMYQTWYYEKITSDYPKPPKDYPNFKKFYDQLDPGTQSMIKVFDANILKHHAYTPADIRMRKDAWASLLPLFEERVAKIVDDRAVMITRVIEDNIVYEGDSNMKGSIEVFYRDQIQFHDRYELENRPTMKEWYEQLSLYEKHIQQNVKKFSIKIAEPEDLIYK